jgi:RNA polymerase sigma-70 factor (ECF subfamily)
MEHGTVANQLNDEQLVVQIASLARGFAMNIVAEDLADDIAQDVALQCWVKIRGGQWRVEAAELRTFVRRVVRRRAVDLLRRSQARDQRHAEYALEASASHHAWMSPELACEERELTEFHEQALGRLPELCRRTYLMVREEEETYQGAALRLGVQRTTVSAHVVSAQQRFRRELAARGISSHAGRPTTVRRRRDRSRSEMPNKP